MRKTLILLSILFAGVTLSAQKVQESIIDFNKDQLSGYLVSFPTSSIELVDAAMKSKLEQEYGLKPSKTGNFTAYKNQNMKFFGTENYDIYYAVDEFGKKKPKTTQLKFIVSTGNMNAISSQTNPEIAERITAFLYEFVSYIDVYSTQVQVNELRAKMDKCDSETLKMQKEIEKNEKQIEKLKEDQNKIRADIEKLAVEKEALKKQIEELQPKQ